MSNDTPSVPPKSIPSVSEGSEWRNPRSLVEQMDVLAEIREDVVNSLSEVHDAYLLARESYKKHFHKGSDETTVRDEAKRMESFANACLPLTNYIQALSSCLTHMRYERKEKVEEGEKCSAEIRALLDKASSMLSSPSKEPTP